MKTATQKNVYTYGIDYQGSYHAHRTPPRQWFHQGILQHIRMVVVVVVVVLRLRHTCQEGFLSYNAPVLHIQDQDSMPISFPHRVNGRDGQCLCICLPWCNSPRKSTRNLGNILLRGTPNPSPSLIKNVRILNLRWFQSD